MFIPALRGIGGAIRGIAGLGKKTQDTKRVDKIQNTEEAAKALKEKKDRELIERYGLKTKKDIKRMYPNNSFSPSVLWAKDIKEVDKIGKDLTRNAEFYYKNKGKRGGYVYTYMTRDKRIKINLRDESKSGGKTIDLMFHETKKIETRIHNIKDLRK